MTTPTDKAPADVQGLVERANRIAGEMERFLGPPEMAPGPDADDLRELASALAAVAQERDRAIERAESWHRAGANQEQFLKAAEVRVQAAEARIATLERELAEARDVAAFDDAAHRGLRKASASSAAIMKAALEEIIKTDVGNDTLGSIERAYARALSIAIAALGSKT